jgi:succinate dehydrogenase/fumarate reductase flavoprotein subunit
MAKEIHAGRATSTGGIFMDATRVPMEVIQKQIPHVYKTCLHRGIDITKTPLEVAPGSHTWLGGLAVDVDGKTPVDGLFAAGETAGGIHGGNRIGGSALSASLVYGRRAGRAAAALAKRAGGAAAEADINAIPDAERAWISGLIHRDSGPLQSDVRMNCRMLAHNKLGPIREARTLKEALAEYERIAREDVPAMRFDDKARGSAKIRGEELESALSVRNLALLGRIVATAALARTESRGAHFRLDFPETDNARWRVVTRLQAGPNGAIEFHTDPVKEGARDALATVT